MTTRHRGTIVERGKSISIVLDLGVDEAGKRRRVWYSGYTSKAAATKDLTRHLNDLDKGDFVDPTKQTFGRFLENEWLPSIASTIRANTHEMYTLNVKKHLIPALGSIQIQKLTASKLNAFYGQLLTTGKLSNRTVQILHRLIRRALADAVRWGRINKNVADLADPPRVRTPEMKVWTPEQLRTFLDSTAKDRLAALWRLAATTGMRRGEILGLRWTDVDLPGARLSIQQTAIIVGHKITFTEPKTAKSRRTVALDGRTVAIMKDHRKRQFEDRLAWGPAWNDSGLVFVQENGSPIHPERLSRKFLTEAGKAKLPAIRFHDLRHSSATAALAAGQPAKVVSERLGHSSIAITLDTYSHVLPSMDEAVASAVAGIIDG